MTETLPRVPPELRDVLDAHPQVVSGAVCFKGTRVPVQALIDTLDGGDMEEFLHGWPDVTRVQALAVIHWEQNQARRAFGRRAEPSLGVAFPPA